MSVFDFFLKLIFTCFLRSVGTFYAILLFCKMLFDTFRFGVKVWGNKNRRKKPVPRLYKSWTPRAEAEDQTPMRWKHCYVTANGIRFHYVAVGKMPNNLKVNEMDGETLLQKDSEDDTKTKPKLLLCLHGFPESWFSWRYLLQSFHKNCNVQRTNGESADYFVVALDMRGFGNSDKPAGIAPYHRKHLVADVIAVIKALGYEKCTLLAHDWGGVVSWELIETHPEVIERFIVLNCPHHDAGVKYAMFHPKQLFINSWYMYVFLVPVFAELYVRFNDYKFLEYIMGDKSAGIQSPEYQINEEEYDLIKYNYEGDATAAGLNYYRALLLPFYQPSKNPPRFKSKTADFSILLLWGDKDIYMNKNMATMTKDYLPATEPASRVEMIPNASHWLQQDKPVEVIQRIREFLAE